MVIPIPEFLKRIDIFPAFSDENDIFLRVGSRVIPVTVANFDVILETPRTTTKDAWYNAHRVHEVDYDFCYEILGYDRLKEWRTEFYFVDHVHTNMIGYMIGFLIYVDDVDIRGTFNTPRRNSGDKWYD